MWKERGWFGTKQGLSRHPAAWGVRRAGTQANWTDDVREKIDGTQIRARQSSAKRLTYLHRTHRGLAVYASRVPDGQTGMLRSQTGTNAIRRIVNLNRGVSRPARNIQHICGISVRQSIIISPG